VVVEKNIRETDRFLTPAIYRITLLKSTVS
jgi:hypothetical protein